jgi:hypothetical protein
MMLFLQSKQAHVRQTLLDGITGVDHRAETLGQPGQSRSVLEYEYRQGLARNR